MRAVIGGEIHLTGLDEAASAAIRAAMSVPNPAIAKKRRLGLPTWYDPPTLPVYRWEGGALVIPRGAAGWLCRKYPDMAVEARRLTVEPVAFHPQIALRPYQEAAVEAMASRTQGVVVMPCGSGKTEAALAAVARIGQPTLWLTHTQDLLRQSLARAQARLGLAEGQWGEIGGGQAALGSHITFATVQTLARRELAPIARRFGMVVVDECHHLFAHPQASAQFERVIRQLPARWRIGLTATAHRQDGLLPTMYMVLGPCIYRMEQAGLAQLGLTVTPVVRMEDTAFAAGRQGAPRIGFGELLAALTADEERNRQIVDDLRALLEAGRQAIVLSARIAHLERLMARLGGGGARRITGATGPGERKAALEDMASGRARVLFASYSLAKEGLDLPGVSLLVLATPQRDPAVIRQALGRIMRPAPGKAGALVLDYVDAAEPVCLSQARARRAVYQDLGCTVTGWQPQLRRRTT